MFSRSIRISLPLLAAVLYGVTQAQTWTPAPSGTTQSLRAAHFSDSLTGFVAGSGGVILKSTNGGLTWAARTSGTPQTLNGLYFTSTSTGYVAGDGGVILKTSDSGATWMPLASGSAQNLNGLWFTHADTGYVIGTGGTILKTVNAGTAWTALASGTSSSLNGFHFTSASIGYAAGNNGIILKTTNAGTNWNPLTSGTTQSLRSIHFLNADTGYVSGDGGVVLRTENGGTTWSTITIGTPQHLLGITSYRDTLYVAGGGGVILRSSIPGNDWMPQTTGTTQSFNVLTRIASGGLVAAGTAGVLLVYRPLVIYGYSQNPATYEAGTPISTNTPTTSGTTTGFSITPTLPKGLAFNVTNGQITGTPIDTMSTKNFMVRAFNSNDTAKLVLSITILPSPVPAVSYWRGQASGTAQKLNTVYFIDSLTGWAGGDKGVVVHTTDGGQHWILQAQTNEYDITSIFFLNADTGWAVAKYGQFWWTTNGGTLWERKNLGAISDANNLHSVFAQDAMRLWVGSTNGVHRSRDGGQTWIKTAFAYGAQSIFIAGSRGWYMEVGNAPKNIYSTNDTGETWTLQYNAATSTPSTLYSLRFSDENHGWATGSQGYLFKTTDGINWTPIAPAATGFTGILYSSYFHNPDWGWAVGGSGRIIRTINAGETWSQQPVWSTNTTTPSKNLRSVFFTNPHKGWAVGDSGVILKYMPLGTPEFRYAGTRIVPQGLPISPFLPMEFIPATTWSITPNLTANTGLTFNTTTGVISGTPTHSSSVTTYTVTATNSAGSTQSTVTVGVIPGPWYPVPFDSTGISATQHLTSLQFIDANIGFMTSNGISSANRVLKTDTRGSSWTAAYSTGNGSSYKESAIHFPNASRGFATRTGGSYLSTTNGGSSWTSTFGGSTSTTEDLNAVHFTDVNTGYMAGKNGTIIKTTNGGTAWTKPITPTVATLHGLHFTDANKGFAVGDSGNILVTENAGSGWVRGASGTTTPLYAIRFTNALTGIVVGNNGMILKTTNGGTTWTPRVSGTTKQLRAIQFPDPLTGFIVGDSGIILRTADAGESWSAQSSGTLETLNALWMFDTENGYVVGNNGTFLRYAGTPPVGLLLGTIATAPGSLMLRGNSFTYTLVSPAPVRIRLLDLQGREVWRLDRASQQAGAYNVTLPIEKLNASLYLLDFRAGTERRTLRILPK